MTLGLVRRLQAVMNFRMRALLAIVLVSVSLGCWEQEETVLTSVCFKSPNGPGED
jgi:hypothetical protein